ncbi:radial spoke protein 10 [Tribonema minus]|uniref:Radial spoke protein 10 n=1 Tax=Tribonema minus TaxID=303371 RepID=A0A835Z6C0_9STRA|nr:radial spoke protein 10 [Tribonema minus]
MAEQEAEYKCEYTDVAEDAEPQVHNWLPRAGKALVTYTDGSTFEGSFNDDRKKHGHGKYTWMKPPGEEDEGPVVLATYEGSYVDGAKCGTGKMTYPNGDTYWGEWKDNLHHGEGTYTYKASSDIYSGTWEAGQKSGQGTYQFGADSSMMQGTWVNGSITEGKWIFKDGTVYAGAFIGGKPIGDGTFTFASGIVQSGAYVAAALPEGEEAAEGAPPRATTWRGNNVLVC